MIIIICFPTVIWFQVFLSNTNNFQTNILQPETGPQKVLPLWVMVDLGIISIHFPELKKWGLTIGYNLVLYPEQIKSELHNLRNWLGV